MRTGVSSSVQNSIDSRIWLPCSTKHRAGGHRASTAFEIARSAEVAAQSTILNNAHQINIQRYALIAEHQQATGLSLQRLGFSGGDSPTLESLATFHLERMLSAISIDQFWRLSIAPLALRESIAKGKQRRYQTHPRCWIHHCVLHDYLKPLT
jgi:hypothetical protein